MRPPHVVLPEATALRLDIAGLGSRMIAAMLDGLIQSLLLLAGFFALGSALPSGPLAIGLGIAWVLIVMFGYFAVFEGLWEGQTPGKRAQRLRVVTVEGQPVPFAAAMLRNVIRIVDFLPGGYAIGAISILLSRREQRLGDLAAGTLVVRIEAVAPPMPLELLPPSAAIADMTARLDVTRIRPEHEQLVRGFLQRRDQLTPQGRSALAGEVAAALRVVIAGGAGDEDERLIEAVAHALRARPLR